MLSELRHGMGMRARLFYFPPAIMQGVVALAGQKRRADGLMGNLEVDASRFRTQIGFEEAMESNESVR